MVSWSHGSHQSPETFCTHYHLFGWIFLSFFVLFLKNNFNIDSYLLGIELM
uniref:Uncharacterized protein n=1 Tax=Mus musculus TaxID=10090 RepID=Q3TS82_MOUSE|nr:unnamed protein product [Mus musculus]